MLLLLTVHALSFHLNIDFGSQFTKSSFSVSTKVPEISFNSDLKTLTPTCIALQTSPNFNFNNTNSLTVKEAIKINTIIGKDAQKLMEYKPWAGSSFLSYYIGLRKNETNRISRDLFVNASFAGLSTNDLTTLFLEKYINSISQKKIVHSVSIVVPAIFTIPQRKEIELIVRESGFDFQSTIDDTEAISSVYLTEKYGKFSNQPKTVLFIDIGATSIKSYCIKFEYTKNKIPQATTLSYSYKNEQGGAYLTKSLVLLIISKYNLINLNDAEYQRLFIAAENIKIELTTETSASYLISSINNDELEIQITRKELESLCESLIQQTIETAKKASKDIKFNDIEIIGGSSRIPIILYSIQNALDVNYISCSLDSDHSLCVGASYYSQIKNGMSQLSDYNIKSSFSPYNVAIRLSNYNSFLICEQEKGCIDEITIDDKITQFDLIYQTSNSLLKTNSISYKIKMMPNTTLKIKFSQSNPIYPISAEMCNKNSYHSCEYISLKPLFHINISSSSLNAIRSARLKKQIIEKSKNKLEVYALKVIKEINQNQTIYKFSSIEQRYRIRKNAESAMKIIRENFDYSIIDEEKLNNYYNRIINDMNHIIKRIQENKTLARNVFIMNHTIYFAKEKLKEWNKKSTIANVDDIMEFSKLVNDAKKWFINAVNVNKRTPLYEDKKYKSKYFEDNTKILNQELFRISRVMQDNSQTNDEYSNLINNLASGFIEGLKKEFVSNIKDELIGSIKKELAKELKNEFNSKNDINDLYKTIDDWAESTPQPNRNNFNF